MRSHVLVSGSKAAPLESGGCAGGTQAAPGGRYAAFATADGRVYGSDDGGLRWLELITGLPSVQHLLLVPD